MKRSAIKKAARPESVIHKIIRVCYSVFVGFFWYYSPLNRFRKMKFISDEELIRQFKCGKSVARFGDGELRIMINMPSNFFQKNDVMLARELSDVAMSDNDMLIVCVPGSLKTLKNFNLRARLFWISNIFWNRESWKKYVNLSKKYGNALITRPYMDYRIKKDAGDKFCNIKKMWDKANICIIEGEQTNLGKGNDLFDNAKKIKRIIAPAKNAFDSFEQILSRAKQVSKDYMFLVALGPTATVLVSELSKIGRRAFDIGHIDVEYEWMLKGSKKKIAIDGKYVNEKRG